MKDIYLKQGPKIDCNIGDSLSLKFGKLTGLLVDDGVADSTILENGPSKGNGIQKRHETNLKQNETTLSKNETVVV